jgi:hypothetical protein
MYCSEDHKSSGSNFDASQAANKNEADEEQNRSVAIQISLDVIYFFEPMSKFGKQNQ